MAPDEYPTLRAELDRLGVAAWATFVQEYDRFADVDGPGSIIERAEGVAMVKQWLGDPLAVAWAAVAVDLSDRMRFMSIVTHLGGA